MDVQMAPAGGGMALPGAGWPYMGIRAIFKSFPPTGSLYGNPLKVDFPLVRGGKLKGQRAPELTQPFLRIGSHPASSSF